MAISGLQYGQTFFNFGCSILGTLSFTTFLTYLYSTHYSCSKDTSCNLYRTIEIDATISFFIIFLPWIGCILAYMGRRQLSMAYSFFVTIFTISILICSVMIISNQEVILIQYYCFPQVFDQIKDTWQKVRKNDQYFLFAPEVHAMIIYNIAITQIICLWFFMAGSAILTPLTAKKQQQKGRQLGGDALKKL